jgi:hypothetical protein
MKTKFLFASRSLIFMILLVAVSCDSFVEVDLPKSQLTTESVFENYNTAEAALTDIYSKIRDRGMLTGDGIGISNHLACYSDEMISNESVSNPSFSFYANALLPTNTIVADYWNSAYNQIYAANSIISGCEHSLSLTQAQRNQLTGEALFIRSLEHFYLLNIFGSVPYVSGTDYKTNSKISKMDSEQMYGKIITDLETAVDLLPESYIASPRIRPNKYAAKALLSRIYLFSGKFPEASNAASAVINNQSLYAVENINSTFLLNSKETLWQLHSGTAGKNTADGAYFIFTAGQPQFVWMSSSLYNSFTDGDLRRTYWTKEVKDASRTWHHPYKYKENFDTSVSKEYTVVLRLSEQFLVRSEARVMQGDLIGAKEDLNKIRKRAGLPDTQAQTQSEILDAVLEERKHELFTEYGHRFFDLKRNGKLNSALGNIKAGWNATDQFFPIPEAEINANPNLKPQNPGY